MYWIHMEKNVNLNTRHFYVFSALRGILPTTTFHHQETVL
jgi:hypothetical protein